MNNNIKLFLANSILWLTIIIVNAYIRSINVLVINTSGGKETLNVTKKYYEYFQLLSLISILLIITSLTITIIYLIMVQRRDRKQFITLVNSFKNANGGKITTDGNLFTSEDLIIINSWNDNVQLLVEEREKRDEYFNMMVHDFKTPIHIIKANLKLYEAYNKGDSNKQIDVMHDEISTLEKEIELFLVIERINFFEKVKPQKTDIKVIFQILIDTYEYKHYNLNVTYKYLNDKYIIDSKMFKKVVENIVENAYKYGLSNKTDVVVENMKITFTNVVDENSELGNIFAINNRKYSNTGNGLGVHIIKKYVELNNWHISSEQKGNKFIVTLIMRNREIL